MKIHHLRKSISELEKLIHSRHYKDDPVILAMLELFKQQGKEIERLQILKGDK